MKTTSSLCQLGLLSLACLTSICANEPPAPHLRFTHRELEPNGGQTQIADIDGDGWVDVLYSHSEKVGWPVAWYSAGSASKAESGPWTEHIIAPAFDWRETLQAGDVDGDGHPDVLAAKFERGGGKGGRFSNDPPYPVVLFLNTKGDGSTWVRQEVADTGTYAAMLGDVGGDGRPDIVAGQWFYRNPGGDLTGKWERTTLAEGVDAVAVVGVNGNDCGDVIALKPSEQFWLEADDRQGTSWTARRCLAEQPGIIDPRHFLKHALGAMRRVYEHKVRNVFGSAGKELET